MRFFCFIAIMLSLSLSVSTPGFSLTNLQSGKISGIYISPAEFAQLPEYLQERVNRFLQQTVWSLNTDNGGKNSEAIIYITITGRLPWLNTDEQ